MVGPRPGNHVVPSERIAVSKTLSESVAESLPGSKRAKKSSLKGAKAIINCQAALLMHCVEDPEKEILVKCKG